MERLPIITSADNCVLYIPEKAIIWIIDISNDIE